MLGNRITKFRRETTEIDSPQSSTSGKVAANLPIYVIITYCTVARISIELSDHEKRDIECAGSTKYLLAVSHESNVI